MWLQSFKNPILCKSFSCSNVFPFHEVLCTQKSSITYFLHSYLLHGWHLQLPPHYTPVGWALLVRKCFIFPAKKTLIEMCASAMLCSPSSHDIPAGRSTPAVPSSRTSSSWLQQQPLVEASEYYAHGRSASCFQTQSQIFCFLLIRLKEITKYFTEFDSCPQIPESAMFCSLSPSSHSCWLTISSFPFTPASAKYCPPIPHYILLG